MLYKPEQGNCRACSHYQMMQYPLCCAHPDLIFYAYFKKREQIVLLPKAKGIKCYSLQHLPE